MAKISENMKALRTKMQKRLFEVREFLTTDDVKTVADANSVTTGSVKQARKGTYFNAQVVADLITAANRRRLTYEMIAGNIDAELPPSTEQDEQATSSEPPPTIPKRKKAKALKTA